MSEDTITDNAPKTITIDIVSDTVCPWCYVGKRRLERALAAKSDDIKVVIGWKPFQLNPEMPEGGMDRRDYLEAKFGGKDGAKKTYSAIEEAGKSEDLDFNFSGMVRQPNTINSHRLIDLAGKHGKQDDVVEALFQAYFLDGRDIGDVDELVSVAVEAGLDEAATRSYLESDEGMERIRGEDAHARQMGVQGVPCFIINRKYAISGAQDPAVFLQAWDQIVQETAEGDAAEAAE